jgi:Flavodoxins
MMLAATLCAMVLTACGNNGGQSSNNNAQNQSGSGDMVQNSETDNQNHEEITGTEIQSDTTEATETPSDTTEVTETQPDTAETTETQSDTTETMEAQQGTTDDGQQEAADNADEQTEKVLVVYYSASGNTKTVAETIAQYTGGDLFEIVPAEAYTSEDLDWRQESSRVNREHEDESLQDIELVSTTVEDFDSYSTVFIGYPIWWRDAAWVVNRFVKDNDFTGKTVIPFCTSSSADLGESGTHLAEMAGTGDWQEGMRFKGGSDENEREVTEWLKGIGF